MRFQWALAGLRQDCFVTTGRSNELVKSIVPGPIRHTFIMGHEHC